MEPEEFSSTLNASWYFQRRLPSCSFPTHISIFLKISHLIKPIFPPTPTHHPQNITTLHIASKNHQKWPQNRPILILALVYHNISKRPFFLHPLDLSTPHHHVNITITTMTDILHHSLISTDHYSGSKPSCQFCSPTAVHSFGPKMPTKMSKYSIPCRVQFPPHPILYHMLPPGSSITSPWCIFDPICKFPLQNKKSPFQNSFPHLNPPKHPLSFHNSSHRALPHPLFFYFYTFIPPTGEGKCHYH